jgi:hypothetical protein
MNRSLPLPISTALQLEANVQIVEEESSPSRAECARGETVAMIEKGVVKRHCCWCSKILFNEQVGNAGARVGVFSTFDERKAR